MTRRYWRKKNLSEGGLWLLVGLLGLTIACAGVVYATLPTDEEAREMLEK